MPRANPNGVNTDRLRVLVVADEQQNTRALREALTARYQVRTAFDAEAALSTVAERWADLVIMEWDLPHLDGLGLCQAIRSLSNLPIIAVSDRRDAHGTVVALDRGVDDYVTKPLHVDELLARIRAKLRRRGAEPNPSIVQAGVFQIELDSGRVHAHGRTVKLTPTEFHLFVYLAQHPDCVIVRHTLLNLLWGPTGKEHCNTLRVHIGHLRLKLEPDPSHPRYLVTDRWLGYQFVPSGNGDGAREKRRTLSTQSTRA